MRDVLPAILRFNDKRELQRYNGMTPVAYDTYCNYSDGVGSNNNVLGGWSLTSDNDLSPRGSWVLNYISNVPVTDVQAPVPPSAADNTVYVNFTVTEPLLLSPWIFCNPQSNNQGFYGIQNLNFNFQITDGSRSWRSANNYGQVVTPYNFTNSRLLFTFLTPHSSLLMNPTNTVGYYELPRYITGNLPSFPAYNPLSPSPQIVRTSTIQLNNIFDKLIIFVRKAAGTMTCNDSDSFLVIQGASFNFNNSSGILASSSQNDLWRMSVNAGSNQSFLEFQGRANVASADGNGKSIGTSGSLLVVEAGRDLQLSNEYDAAGLLGNFNLQINLTVLSQYDVPLTNTEIVVITMNSGVCVNERGVCSTYLGCLTKSDVLEASQMEPYSRSEVQRLVGGGFLDTLKSVAGKLNAKLPLAKKALSMVDHPVAKKAVNTMSNLGYGMSAGGYSGGGYSGGRSRLSDRIE
jgi:hypothetical protein